MAAPGLLALVGGDEFNPGNEEQDRLMVEAAPAGGGPAFVVPTAAARQGPEKAVAHATAWFAALGLELSELRVLRRTDANSKALVDEAARGRLFYLVGGDPGLVVEVLRESRVWTAIVQAWLGGAVLAGSSAGAMALCGHSLIRRTWPNRFERRPTDGLGVVPGCAVLPHFNTFGERWIESAQRELPGVTLVGVDERSAAMWQGGRWTAAGPGTVTIIKGERKSQFESGQEVSGLPEPVRTLPV